MKPTFEEVVLGMVENMSGDFKPFVMKNEGDEIEVFASRDDYHAKWINPHLSLYFSDETGNLVGCCIHGVSRLMKLE
jgi:hypothetical protein